MIIVTVFGGSAASRAGSVADDEPRHDPASIALDFYQGYLSSLRHTRCRFHPSCSEYARQAIERYGFFSGTARAADRLVRCNASAGRFYGRGADGLLVDPVTGDLLGPLAPRLEPWLLPAFPVATPAWPAMESGDRATRKRIDEVVSFARQLAADGDCARAETEYLRAAHLARSDAWGYWSQLQIGACYLEAGAYRDAERCYLHAGMLASDREERDLAQLLLASSLFDAGRFGSSAQVLWHQDATDRALTLRGLAQAARGRWELAEADLAAGSSAATNPLFAARVDRMSQLVASGPDLPHRSPGLGMFMSAVLPGSGQVYSGRTHDGFRHLLFNGILIYTIAKLIDDDHYPAAYGMAVIGVPFYVGNIKGARQAARTHNRVRRLELTAEAITEAGRIGLHGEEDGAGTNR